MLSVCFDFFFFWVLLTRCLSSFLYLVLILSRSFFLFCCIWHGNYHNVCLFCSIWHGVLNDVFLFCYLRYGFYNTLSAVLYMTLELSLSHCLSALLLLVAVSRCLSALLSFGTGITMSVSCVLHIVAFFALSVCFVVNATGLSRCLPVRYIVENTQALSQGKEK